jgi:hypothetical protein
VSRVPLPQYNELPTILVRAKTIPLYDRISEQADYIRRLERENRELSDQFKHIQKMATAALSFGKNVDAVREALRDIITNARRATK